MSLYDGLSTSNLVSSGIRGHSNDTLFSQALCTGTVMNTWWIHVYAVEFSLGERHVEHTQANCPSLLFPASHPLFPSSASLMPSSSAAHFIPYNQRFFFLISKGSWLRRTLDWHSCTRALVAQPEDGARWDECQCQWEFLIAMSIHKMCLFLLSQDTGTRFFPCCHCEDTDRKKCFHDPFYLRETRQPEVRSITDAWLW